MKLRKLKMNHYHNFKIFKQIAHRRVKSSTARTTTFKSSNTAATAKIPVPKKKRMSQVPAEMEEVVSIEYVVIIPMRVEQIQMRLMMILMTIIRTTKIRRSDLQISLIVTT
jgi:hypothetical protein